MLRGVQHREGVEQGRSADVKGGRGKGSEAAEEVSVSKPNQRRVPRAGRMAYK